MYERVAVFVILGNPIRAPRGSVWGDRVGTQERVRESAVGRLVVRGRINASSEGDGRSSHRHTILAVVDAAAVRKHVDVGTLGAKFAVALRTKVAREVSTARIQGFPPVPEGVTTQMAFPFRSACCDQLTFAKYLQIFSAAAPRS